MKLDSDTKKVLGYKGNYLSFLRHCNRRINNKKDFARYQLDLLFKVPCKSTQQQENDK